MGNIMLLRNTFTPAVIYPDEKNDYIRALLGGHQDHDITPFVEFIASKLVSSQEELIDQAKDWQSGKG